MFSGLARQNGAQQVMTRYHRLEEPTSYHWLHTNQGHCARRAFSATSKPNTATPSTTSVSTAVAAVALVFGGAMGARWWYSSTVGKHNGYDSILFNSKTGAPRQDQSKVTIVLPGETIDTISKTKTSTAKTENALLQVNLEELREFFQTQQAVIESQQLQAKEETRQTLHQQLSAAFQDCRERGVPQFAKWYFSYTTTYKLFSIAMKSAAKHALTIQKESTLQQAVTQDLQLYICDKYQALVLRPAVTDPKIHKAVLQTLEQVYEMSYQPAMGELETAMQRFAQGHSDDVEETTSTATSSRPRLTIPADSVVLELDWKAQLQKAVHLPVAYEKNPPEFSVAIIGGSAIAGKAMGGAAVKAVSAKLAAPFAAKAVGSTLGGKAAAGAAAAGGMMAGGPLGAGMGAAIGIGMDMAVNKGISLMQRSAFEADVQESLDATILEWEAKILPEVDRLVQEDWFGQLQAMLQANVDEKNTIGSSECQRES
jgi:hypothetical protein